MEQTIKQNGIVLFSSPENYTCTIIFRNLTGLNFKGEEYKKYLLTMFRELPELKHGEIELWENGKLKSKGIVP